jgi:hypothetical protein
MGTTVVIKGVVASELPETWRQRVKAKRLMVQSPVANGCCARTISRSPTDFRRSGTQA